jgi:hypothetical protein
MGTYEQARALRARAYTLVAVSYDLHAQAHRLMEHESDAVECERHAESYRRLAAELTAEVERLRAKGSEGAAQP